MNFCSGVWNQFKFKTSLNVVAERIVLHVDLDYFYAQCEELRNPQLKGRPVAVCIYSGRTEDSGAVSTSNYAARKLGIRSGMPIAFAKRNATADTVFLRADLDYYETVSERIMSYLRTFSHVMEQASVDEAYLELTGISSGFDQAADVGMKLKKGLVEAENLTCSVGIGPNKLISKMAAAVNKPDGLTVITPDQSETFLSPMPVGKLFGVGKVTEKRLNEEGIETVEQLRENTLQELKKKFGAGMGAWLYNSSRGIDDEAVVERKREQYGRIVTLKADTRDPKILNDTAGALLADVVGMVRKDGQAFRTVTFIGIMDDLATRTKNRSLQEYTDDVESCTMVMQQLIEEFLAEHGGNLRRMGVKVSNLGEKKGQKMLSDFM